MKTNTAPLLRHALPYPAKSHRYILFVNSELIGRFSLLTELIDTLSTISGNIKIQTTNTFTKQHKFTTFTKSEVTL